MKVNPIGIQSYQQLNRNEKPSGQANGAQTQIQDGIVKSDQNQLTIKPAAEESSRIAVKAARGSYADLLSPQEKQALDLLFSRYRDNSRFGPAYKSSEPSQNETESLGSLVDVKV